MDESQKNLAEGEKLDKRLPTEWSYVKPEEILTTKKKKTEKDPLVKTEHSP